MLRVRTRVKTNIYEGAFIRDVIATTIVGENYISMMKHVKYVKNPGI